MTQVFPRLDCTVCSWKTDGLATKSLLTSSRWTNTAITLHSKQPLPGTTNDKLPIIESYTLMEKEGDLARVPRRVVVPSARATGAPRGALEPTGSPFFSSFAVLWNAFFVVRAHSRGCSCLRPPCSRRDVISSLRSRPRGGEMARLWWQEDGGAPFLED